jgi:hypothetical protein
VSYATSHETAEDVRDKYQWRRRWVRGGEDGHGQGNEGKASGQGKEEEKKRVEEVIERGKPKG